MKLKKFIKEFNEADILQKNNLNDFEVDVCEKREDLLNTLKDWKIELVETGIKRDVHRWYETTTNVFQIVVDGVVRYVGLSGVSDLRSENMNYEDCFEHLTCQEMKRVVITSYEFVK